MLPNKEPIVIELDIKKLMIDNLVITGGLVILFTAIQYICFKDFHFSFLEYDCWYSTLCDSIHYFYCST